MLILDPESQFLSTGSWFLGCGGRIYVLVVEFKGFGSRVGQSGSLY